jgi:hypothetical protein
MPQVKAMGSVPKNVKKHFTRPTEFLSPIEMPNPPREIFGGIYSYADHRWVIMGIRITLVQ